MNSQKHISKWRRKNVHHLWLQSHLSEAKTRKFASSSPSITQKNPFLEHFLGSKSKSEGGLATLGGGKTDRARRRGEGRRVMSWRSRGGGGGGETVSKRWTFLLCLGSFFTGLLFTNRMWTMPEVNESDIIRTNRASVPNKELVAERYFSQMMNQKEEARTILGEGSSTVDDLQLINKAVSNLEMELAAARTTQESILRGYQIRQEVKVVKTRRHKYFMVIGINTAFNSRKRRDSIRATWMPQGDKRKKLEEEKGIVICFVIGHGATSGGILNRAIDAEEKKHGDFLRLDHVEGYLELSAKTKSYFATAFSLWDAEFYVKVDDDVHVNIATLGHTLVKHRMKPRVYIGCMKCGPVLAKKGVRYYEPENWKFGGDGNKYFRHATGQLYAISNELAAYISINQHILHKYVNEDVSLGSWLIGLDVEHIDDRKLCCGSPPDCEWKAQAGNTCVASFDWSCSGICDSVDRIKEVHQRCSENSSAIWNAVF